MPRGAGGTRSRLRPRGVPLKIPGAAELAPALLRLVVGVSCALDGYAKVFGGMRRFVPEAARALGLHWSAAYAVAYVELFGGVLLVAGLLTRWTAVPVAFVAALEAWRAHLAGAGRRPLEFWMLVAAAAVSLAVTGGGAFSLDRRWRGK